MVDENQQELTFMNAIRKLLENYNNGKEYATVKGTF